MGDDGSEWGLKQAEDFVDGAASRRCLVPGRRRRPDRHDGEPCQRQLEVVSKAAQGILARPCEAQREAGNSFAKSYNITS